MIRLRTGVVREVTGRRPGAIELSVDVDGEAPAAAIAYPSLVGGVEPGARVLLNTTAVALGLGTGGWHFVVAVLDGPPTDADGPGHVPGGQQRRVHGDGLEVAAERLAGRHDRVEQPGLAQPRHEPRE